MTRRRVTVPSTRSLLYKTARTLGDVQAIRTGHVGRRVRNRIVGRTVGKTLGRFGL